MKQYTLSEEQIDRIVSLADEFDAAAELVIMLAKEIKSKCTPNDIELPF